MPVNSELQDIIDLWSERPPSRNDFDHRHGEMFLAPHIIHVGQGQGIINVDACTRAIDQLGVRNEINRQLNEYSKNRSDH